MLKKILKWTGLILLFIIVGVTVIVLLNQNKKYDAPYPNIKASTDSTVLARGKYLVYGPAHCADCHAKPGTEEIVNSGAEVDLPGGRDFAIPIGHIYPRNITPDKETGIGNISDEAIARSLRYGVGHDGRALFDFMPFHDMSDADLTAVISYIRTIKPVNNKVSSNKLNPLGMLINAFVLKPVGPTGTPAKEVKPDSTVEYGRYLAVSVANCNGCHTDRDLMTGAFIGEPFAGGFKMESIIDPENHECQSPNLTPDKETGRIYGWSEDMFRTRLRQGKLNKHSPMAWGPFSRMSDMEITAIYKYLQTVKPVNKKIEQTFYKRKA
jgi:mono/diheme cytochrome c family protein